MRSLRSEKLRRKRRNSLFIKVVLYLFGIFALVYGPAFISKMNFVQIRNIKFSGNSRIPEASLKEVVRSNLDGNYFKLYSKSSIFLYNKNKIKEDILQKFVRIENIEISLNRFKELEIVVKEREPFAVWCPGDFNLNFCLFLDNEGLAYDQISDISPKLFIKYRSQNSEVEAVGRHPIQEDIFNKTKKIPEKLLPLDLKVVEMFFEDNKDLTILTDKNLKIVFKTDDDFDRAVSNLESLLNDSKLGVKNEKGEIAVSSIDLRFGNKVFYK